MTSIQAAHCRCPSLLYTCAAAVVATCPGAQFGVGLQVRYCLHVQQRLLKVEWPNRLAEHHMARTISVGDMDGGGPGGQILYNGLRVRMAISTGMPALTLHRLGNLHQLDSLCNIL